MEDSCSWVKEMLDIVGVGARTKFGRYTKGLWGGAGGKVTEGDILLLDSASVDVDGDSRGGVVVSCRGEYFSAPILWNKMQEILFYIFILQRTKSN